MAYYRPGHSTKRPGRLLGLGVLLFLLFLPLSATPQGLQERYPTPPPQPLSFFEPGYDGGAPAESDTALEKDLPQDVLDIAKSLGNNPSDLFGYVLENYSWEPFYGILKGPDGVLKTGSGSAQDLASLLLLLLRAQGIPSRLIKLDMSLPVPALMNLLGVTTPEAATRTIQTTTSKTI